MEKVQLLVKGRDKEEKASQLRKQGFIPAVLYNHGKTDSIKVVKKDLRNLFSSGVTESTLIEVDFDGKKETAFVKNYQLHPVSDEVLHLDLYRVTFGEKIKTSIQINFVGKPEGVKEGGILETFLHEVEVETLPQHLVPSIDLDISSLKIGDALFMEDIPLASEIEILVEGNPILCSVAISAQTISDDEDSEVSDSEDDTGAEEE